MPVYKPEPVAETVDPVTGEVKAKKTFDVIPDGTWLPAKVLAIEEVEKPYKEDDGVTPVRKVEWTFGIAYEGQDRKAWGETSTKWVPHPGCKMRAWTQEILAADLPEEFVLNTDHLLNLQCEVMVGVRSWDTPTSKGSKNFVADVKRASGNTAPVPAAAGAGYDDPFDVTS